MTEHEKEFIRAFIIKAKRPRYLSQLADLERCEVFIFRLGNCTDLDARYMRPIRKREAALDILKDEGSPDNVFIISVDPELDEVTMPLENALREISKSGEGSVISCIPGKLAYYSDEMGKSRAVLIK